MPSYTVPITGPNGPGFMTVNASSPQAAQENASQGGNVATGGAMEGGHQAHTGTGGTAVAGGLTPGAPGTPSTPGTPTGGGLDAILQALQAGDQRAFDEAVRTFNANFGLNVDRFHEDIRQYNQNFGLNQAAITGAYQGAPTLPALTSYATQFGTWGAPTTGQQTLAAQQQAETIAQTRAGLTGQFQGAPTLAAQQQAYAQQLGAIQAAAAQQANPFRQAQVIGQLGGLLRGGGVAGFQAPGAAQGQTDFSGMGNMARLIEDIRGGPGAINSASTQSVLDAIPTPAKLNSVEFNRASPLTQNMVLQGMQEKFGLSPEDSLKQIQNTLPQFQSPTTFGGVKR